MKKSPMIRLVLLVLFGLGATAALVTLIRTDWHEKTIEVNGVQREFLFYAPGENEDKNLPLLLIFHGFSGNADRIRRSSKLHELVNKHKFYLAYLNGDPTWRRPTAGRSCADIDFFDQLCDKLESEHAIDSSRIYVAGMSMGGDFAIRLGGMRSERIAAVVSQGMITEDVVDAERPFPLLVIVGTKDDRVSSSLLPDVPDKFRERGHLVELIRPEGIGHWWHVPLNEEIWEFLTQHRLEK